MKRENQAAEFYTKNNRNSVSRPNGTKLKMGMYSAFVCVCLYACGWSTTKQPKMRWKQ